MTPLRLTFPIPPFLQVTWLAKWKDSINGEDKCVWLAANSSWKGKSDLAKYEKARKLKDHIGKVREDYMAGMLSRDPISHTPHSHIQVREALDALRGKVRHGVVAGSRQLEEVREQKNVLNEMLLQVLEPPPPRSTCSRGAPRSCTRGASSSSCSA